MKEWLIKIMDRNNKARLVVATNAGSNQNQINNAGGIPKRFDVFYYRQFDRLGQSIKCMKCGSDYMRFSVGGYCQHCQQKVEFIVREHPHVARDARNQKPEAAMQ